MEIIKEEKYRSKPYVNMTDDMVRLTLTCDINEWKRLKKVIQEDIYKKALEEIVNTQGKVCEEFEICDHIACKSSCASWFIADKALKDAEGSDLYKGE